MLCDTPPITRLLAGVFLAAGTLAGNAHAIEPANLIELAHQAPKPPWPAGDEIGMANTLGPATRLRCAWHMAQADAQWFEASQVRSASMPQSPFASPTRTTPKPTAGVPFSRHAFNSETFDANAEPGQQGTQIDALGHFARIDKPWDPATPFSAEGAQYYGGFTQEQVKPSPDSPLLKLDIAAIPPLVSTAVLLDAQAFVGKGEPMAAGATVTAAHIEGMLAAQGLAERGILPGDMVWIHTGWGRRWQDPATDTPYYGMAPGLSVDAAAYLGDKHIVAIGFDTPFIDAAPEGMLQGKAPPAEGTPEGLPFAIHDEMLTRLGVYQFENLNLAQMADAGVWTSCAMVLPSRDKGAAGAPIRPVAVGSPKRR